jgi:DNA polymerase
VSDLSSIEGRALAWLARESWKLTAYAEVDAGMGYDMYVLTYARTFNEEASGVTKYQRQLGKVLELALGYAGGVGAFLTFAHGYNIDLNEIQ